MKQFSSIVITGASSGIGAALAKRYAKPDVAILLMGRNEQRLREVADYCIAQGATAVKAACDIRDREAVRSALAAYDQMHPVELLIANAGISAGLGTETESEAQVREVFAVNLDGVLNTVLPVLPWMQARGRGHIVLMSSLAGIRGLPSCPAYSASKMAVRGFGEALRGAYRKYGVTVSVLCPGYITTPLTDVNTYPMPFIMSAEKAARKMERGIALSRARIAFPLALYLPLWLLSCLPVALTDWFFAALPKKSSLPANGNTHHDTAQHH